MNVDREKMYLISTSTSWYASKYLVTGNDLEIEGNAFRAVRGIELYKFDEVPYEVDERYPPVADEFVWCMGRELKDKFEPYLTVQEIELQFAKDKHDAKHMLYTRVLAKTNNALLQVLDKGTEEHNSWKRWFCYLGFAPAYYELKRLRKIRDVYERELRLLVGDR